MRFCPSCGTERAGVFCGTCGYRFPGDGSSTSFEPNGVVVDVSDPESEVETPSFEPEDEESIADSPLPGSLIINVDGVAQRFSGQGKITIGRADTNDVIIEDKTVSRRHCEISFDEVSGRWQIFDLASANGVQIDGAFVVEAQLSVGATVRLGENEGDVEFTIEFSPPRQTVTQPRPVTRVVKPKANVASLDPVTREVGAIQLLSPVIGLKYGDGFDAATCCANCGQRKRSARCDTCDR